MFRGWGEVLELHTLNLCNFSIWFCIIRTDILSRVNHYFHLWFGWWQLLDDVRHWFNPAGCEVLVEPHEGWQCIRQTLHRFPWFAIHVRYYAKPAEWTSIATLSFWSGFLICWWYRLSFWNEVVILKIKKKREQYFVEVRHKPNWTVSAGLSLLRLFDIQDFCYDFPINFLTNFFCFRQTRRLDGEKAEIKRT